jgi:uncharacterized protein (DUF305 family)
MRSLARPLTLLIVLGRVAGGSDVQGQAAVGRYPITRADVDFVTGMISHHAQAIVMAEWAPERASTRAVQVLSARIVNAQTDEIVILQRWLADHGQPVPDAVPVPTRMTMDGMEHEMMMPGMLTEAQMRELEGAAGPRFDELFLAFMIQHHEGALVMVSQLFASPGAAQDEQIFKLASDVFSDQTVEIERMRQMLSALPPR